MTTEYRTVYEGGEGEIVEKKSRFIAAVKPVSAEDEALAFIESVRKRHWNATHNCYAYVIGERSELARCSDDGEPNGTAGKPMLDVLQGEELRNTAVVVTRYFGVTLLGTGGRGRAYAQAVKAGLASSVIITKIRGVKLRIGTDYTGLGKIQYILGQKGLKILGSEYADNVKLEVLVPEDAVEAVRSDITEGSSGQASMEEGEECWFAQIDGQPVVLEEYTG